MAHAQGTVEYLVIVAVVVVLSLVVVGLLVNQTSSVNNISASTSRISSSSGVISISEVVVGVDGNGLITFANNSGGVLSITRVSVEGVDTNYSSVSMVSGDEKSFLLRDVNSGCSCVGFEGKTRVCDVVVSTVSEYGLEKQVSMPVSVDCVLRTVAKNTSVVVQPFVASEGNAPVVFLLSPADSNRWTSASVVRFDFNFSDESGVSSCNLLVNSVDVNSIVPVSGTNTISYRLDDLNFVWDVNCTDVWGNRGHASAVRNLSVDANAYQVNTCLQLQDMNLNLAGNYLLMNDVNCYGDTYVAGGALYNGGSGFIPVGTSAARFTGTFDGNYHDIKSLRINRASLVGVGLFGYIYGATISKVGMVGGYFNGLSWVSALVGDSNVSTISKCHSDFNESIGAFEAGSYLGGLIGNMNGGLLEESYANGNLSTGSAFAGGLVGGTDGNSVIQNCYSTGNTNTGREGAGGISGMPNGLAIKNSYTTGIAAGGYWGGGGGLAGAYRDNTGSVTSTNSFSTGNMTGGGTSGTVVSSANTVTNSYYLFTESYNYGTLEAGGASAFYVSTHAVYNGSPAWDFTNVWTICSGTRLPSLKWENRSC